MNSNRLLHTPDGVRDIYGRELLEKHALGRAIGEKISSFGYKEIETPSFEYFDVYAQDMDMAPSREIYKFFDNENMTLALRPDFT
ncbi:MAG: ATP phosphoribosyltransferase regulatory subunit, partial [Lachnospiraceae bacterium]|nr:ATP phosphoribosyltransferase regulatory subunit [Lachnospiraceae bacterium]